MTRPSSRVAAAALLAAVAACRTAPREPAAGGAQPAAQEQGAAEQGAAEQGAAEQGAAERAAPAPASVRSDTGARRYSEADVQFMRHMMAHHAQAVAMTALVPDRSSRQDVRLVAQRIESSQRDETALMERWLRSRGHEVEAAGGAHAHHTAGGQPAPMPGMLTEAELAGLAKATGPEFDRLFLEYMIRHHEGALAMVAELLATPGAGQEPEIFRFVSDVDADQRAEIRRLRTLQAGPAR